MDDSTSYLSLRALASPSSIAALLNSASWFLYTQFRIWLHRHELQLAFYVITIILLPRNVSVKTRAPSEFCSASSC